MSIRFGTACLVLFVLVLLTSICPPAVIADDRMLEGQVVDARGRAVADATVFVTRLARPGPAAGMPVGLRGEAKSGEDSDRVLKSGPDGTFSATLVTGRYRIAAFKPGYQVALADVNLQARVIVEVRMRPSGKTRSESPDGDDQSLDWILRRSDDDVLRELEAGPMTPLDGTFLVSDARERDVRPALFRLKLSAIEGSFSQGLTGSSLLGGASSGADTGSGRSTRLALHGNATERGTWRFDGRADRATSPISGDETDLAGRASVGAGVGFDYRFDRDDELGAGIRYGARHYGMEAGAVTEEVDQEADAASLGATWKRELSGRARLYVIGSYLEATVREPVQVVTSGGASTTALDDRESWDDRSAKASAGLALKMEGHDIDVGVRVHSYRYDLEDGGALLLGVDPAATPLEPGSQGTALSLFGADDWHVADRYVVNYGVGYHSDFDSGAAYVVPTIGLTTTLPEAGKMRLRSAVMYRVLETGPSMPVPSAGRPEDFRAGGRLGYEIGVERRPEDRLQFSASFSYHPFQNLAGADQTEPAAGALLFDEEVLVLTDASAARHEMVFEVQRGFGLVRGMLQGSIGRVQGRLSPIFNEGPVVELQAAQARYYLTALRAMIEPTDTEVRIDYRKVVGESDAGDSVGALLVDYRRLDLAVFQDLPFSIIAKERWRVLMAYQGLLSDSNLGPGYLPGTGGSTRLTGGVDISF